MDVKPGYKQMEVGVIPEDWVIYEIEKKFLGVLELRTLG